MTNITVKLATIPNNCSALNETINNFMNELKHNNFSSHNETYKKGAATAAPLKP